jgi:hypothetical protein
MFGNLLGKAGVGVNGIDNVSLENDLWRPQWLRAGTAGDEQHERANLTEGHGLFTEVATKRIWADVAVPQNLRGADCSTSDDESLPALNESRQIC